MDQPPTPPTPRRGLGPALLWACFLGCSWTWVIGMFLPIMLLRDYGVAGWVAFAIPNVLGAAAMGTVLGTPGRSWALVQQHAGALRWFSVVTIAFHIYVVFWLFNSVWPALLCVLPWVVMDAGRRLKLGNALPWVGVGVTLLSWGAFALCARLDAAWLDVSRDVFPSRLTPTDLGLMIPGLLAGFALCPYMDATFHRARYSTTSGTGKAAFAVGFGVVFGSMIVFSLMYAGLLRPWVAGHDSGAITPPWRALLAFHVAIQVGFTLLAHGREALGTLVPVKRSQYAARVVIVLLLTLGAAAFARLYPPGVVEGLPEGMSLGEVGYRLFLLMYAVPFPAYVLLCMMPRARKYLYFGGERGQPAGNARLAVFWVTTLLGYPVACVAFIPGPSWWMLVLYGLFVAAWGVVQVLPAHKKEPRQ